jgi:type I restriction-modification system DNA methylase subunit
MSEDKLYKYLSKLGFSNEEIQESLHKNVFNYHPHPNTPSIKYILVESYNNIFEQHKRLWNINSDNAFIAIDSDKSYLINVKEKPDSSAPLKKSICIESFNYGINTEEYNEIDIEKISKDYITSTYFYQYIQERQRNKHEVDKDLLLNLLALRNDLLDGNNDRIIHLLILRCLFVKYLEDRGIFEDNFLTDILAKQKSSELIGAFNNICKINGDIFGENKLREDDIKIDYLEKLTNFFNSDYRSGQGTLFPYQFDCIPIQLISHVYEAFLKNDTKKGKGVYYTPSFVVGFMLSQSLKPKAIENPNLSVLDPAVGSGAFLVESFKIIRDSHNKKLDFDAKKRILKTQLFGIDIDSDALQITAFSLYLALLEDEKPEFIKEKIKHAHPILPSLIGNTLIRANSITNAVFKDKKFDCIVSNPPWGPVSSDKTEENDKERKAIDNKNGTYPEYSNVANYERSQAFLMCVAKWQKEDSLTAMIVKNSIFLNDKAENFRNDFLTKFKLDTFLELSHYNKILFKKKVIGKINGKAIEIGASEPCAIVIYRNNNDTKENTVHYISPKLTRLAEHFELIQYTSNDSFYIKQSEFLNNGLLWRILVKGTFEDFELIKKMLAPVQSDKIICSRGFEASKNMKRLKKEPYLRTLIKSEDFEQYFIKKQLSKFDWNQKLHRERTEDLYKDDKILIAYRPKRSDNYKLRCIQYSSDCVFRNDILCFKVENINNHRPFLALLNSSLMGYFIYMISSQWDGGLKREALRTYDIKAFDYDSFDYNNISLNNVLDNLITSKRRELLKEIDSLVLESFNLLDYEKEIIREFYQVNVDRANPELQIVTIKDIQEYFSTFTDTFSLVLSPKHSLTASYFISTNVGAVIKISIVDKEQSLKLKSDSNLQILNFVKSKQLTETDKLLREEKVKIYEQKYFYIIKSNQFKDWTKRQAIKDAKEEIEMFVKHLGSKR